MNTFIINQQGHSVVVKTIDGENELTINFSNKVLEEDLEDSPIAELINQLNDYLHEPGSGLTISGENTILLTHRYSLGFSGRVSLTNCHLANPYIVNSVLENVDLDISKFTGRSKFIYSLVENASISDPSKVTNVCIKFSQVTGMLHVPSDNRSDEIFVEYEHIIPRK